MESQTLKILVVDDDPFVRAMLRDFLESEGYEVTTAKNGPGALRQYARDPGIGLILSDMNMADMDGLELVKTLRKEDREVPVIILTVNNKVSVAIEAIKNGANDYILKDENIEETILICIRKVMEKRQLKRQNRILLADLEKKNQELAASNRELMALNQLKNKFLGIAAHDLRGPIAGIKGIADLLMEEVRSEDQREHLRFIDTTADELLTLINDLLDVSVIESGQLELCPRINSFRDLINRRIRLHRPIAGKKEMVIHTEFDEVPDFSFDACRMAQVLDNLISNAIKYSPAGSDIHVRLASDGRTVQVSIRDQGPGIPDAEQSRLFSPFQKLSAKPTAGEPSIGLGLAITRNIVRAHNGNIAVVSQVGKGTTFIVMLPTEQH